MVQLNVSFLLMVTQEVKANLYVFGLGVENGFFGYAYGTGAITKQRHSSEMQAIVSQSSYHPKQLGTTSSSGNILSFDGGLGYARLLARRPRHKRRPKKLTSPRSGLSIHTTPSIISIRKASKRKRGRSRIPKAKLRSVPEIPEDPLHRLAMRGAR